MSPAELHADSTEADGPLRLTTQRLVLRELEADDWVAMRALDADPQIVRYMSTDVVDEQGTRTYLAEAIAAAAVRPRQRYELAVTLAPDPTFVGRVGLDVERPAHRDAQIWFSLRRDLWGRGLVTEAMRRLLTLAFDGLGLHRVWADVDPRNTASVRVLEKLGMRREAHLRESWWLKGEWCDAWIHALLEHEWRQAAEPSSVGRHSTADGRPSSQVPIGG